MKKSFFLLAILMALACPLRAQDTVDVLHYDLGLDLGHSLNRTLVGDASLTLRLAEPAPRLRLRLHPAEVDSVFLDGERVEGFSLEGGYLLVPHRLGAGDTARLRVCYRTEGVPVERTRNGFMFDQGVYFSLSHNFHENDPSEVNAWYPRPGGYTDKATYRFRLTAPAGWSCTCAGVRDTVWTNADGSEGSVWTLSRPVSAYAVSVAAGPFQRHEKVIHGLYGDYPLIVAFRGMDSAYVAESFALLDTVVPLLERLLGPYRWGTIGYCHTTVGGMEHVNNIALAPYYISTDREAQRTIVHELAHQWFGNLVTCASGHDMWINEGGATFAEELVFDWAYEQNLAWALQTNQANPQPLTLIERWEDGAMTTYMKGGVVLHTLRHYLGDSLFFASWRELFSRAAFTNISTLQLRDSLSLYSGEDLTDFFDFHVLRPGMQDLVLDHWECGERDGRWVATVDVRQKITCGGEPARGNRVPVTFLRRGRELATEWLRFDGDHCHQRVPLPEQADCAVLDLHRQVSDAALDNSDYLHKGETLGVGNGYFTLMRGHDDTVVFLHAARHYCWPDGEFADSLPWNPGILRMLPSYWTVSGYLPSPMLLMVKLSTSSGELYSSIAQRDSVRMLYRADVEDIWHIVNATGSTGAMGTYALQASGCKPGQYTLAIVDEQRMGADAPEAEPLRVFPNPTTGPLHVEHASAPSPALELYDLQGRRLLSQPAGSAPLTTIDLGPLPAGVYLLRAGAEARRVVKR